MKEFQAAIASGIAMALFAAGGCARKSSEMLGTDAAAGAGTPTQLDAPTAADGAMEPETPTARQQVLGELVRVVVLPAFVELGSAAPALAGTMAALRRTPSRESLIAAREAWQRARARWRRTNAFGIGPGDDIGVTGGIIDEPTDVMRLDGLLAAETALDLTTVRSLGANVRGFLALEHLLFVPDVTPEEVARMFEGQPGARRALHVELLGADLEAKLVAVAEAWAHRFGRELVLAGRGSTEYRSERDAYDALMNKALTTTDRAIDILRQGTGGAMSARPLPITLRSDNVAEDLLEDLRGLEALYTGRSGNASARLSIADLVREASAGVDAELTRALDEARLAVEALPRPVGAQAASGAPVVRAITALRMVKAALSSGVFTVLGVSVGFSDNDGD